MKNLIISLFVIFAAASASAVGFISVNVDGTTYSCTPGGQPEVDCPSKIQYLKDRMELCRSAASTMTCIDKLWPTFKMNNPTCLDQASTYCLDVCRTAASTMTCLDKCQ